MGRGLRGVGCWNWWPVILVRTCKIKVGSLFEPLVILRDCENVRKFGNAVGFDFTVQPASTGGLFGAQPQAGKSLFGQPTTTTATGLFGATATPAIGAFGAKPTAQATSLFAQPAASTATSAFSFNTTQTPSKHINAGNWD